MNAGGVLNTCKSNEALRTDSSDEVLTFVTGSDTSSNILFAKLQAHVANQLGMTGQSTFFG